MSSKATMTREGFIARIASVFFYPGVSPLVRYHRRLQRKGTHAIHTLKNAE